MLREGKRRKEKEKEGQHFMHRVGNSLRLRSALIITVKYILLCNDFCSEF